MKLSINICNTDWWLIMFFVSFEGLAVRVECMLCLKLLFLNKKEKSKLLLDFFSGSIVCCTFLFFVYITTVCIFEPVFVCLCLLKIVFYSLVLKYYAQNDHTMCCCRCRGWQNREMWGKRIRNYGMIVCECVCDRENAYIVSFVYLYICMYAYIATQI